MKHFPQILLAITLFIYTNTTTAQSNIEVKPEGTIATQKQPVYVQCANHFQLTGKIARTRIPRFTTTNGSLIPGATVGSFALFPGAVGESKVEVYYGDKLWNTLKFKVVAPPPALVILKANGKVFFLNEPLSHTNFTLSAKPDEIFKKRCSRDGTFRVLQALVTQLRKGQTISKKKVVGAKFDLKKLGFKLQSGDKFTVEATHIQRISSRGTIHKASGKNTKISFTVK